VDILKEGEMILLVTKKDQRFLLTLKEGEQFHYQRGVVSHSDILGKTEGCAVKSSMGEELTVFRPTLADYILKLKRRTQIIYPKDIGAILVRADIYPGANVLEAGVGSGALTLALLRTVGDRGKVISYENRPEFAALALENIERFLGDKPENFELKVGNIYEEIPEETVDRVILDLPEPWRALPQVEKALKPGGIVLAHIATTLQIHEYVETLRKTSFSMIETFEVLVRPWHVKDLSVRPEHRMVAHTGFMSLARKKAVSEKGT